jgi:glucosamine 6-phosphate synthetase-like amidotransferase/phosphosugar isomerase protein
MCSIVGSYSKTKFIELIKLNTYRGAFSHSLTIIKQGSYDIVKDFGPFNEDLLNTEYYEEGDYLLGHCQAPTNGLVQDYDRIHPYQGKLILLHNGIIKDAEVDRINAELGNDYVWDTQALAEYIQDDFTKLSDIEGSFACGCIKNNELFVFRNAISPLYRDVDSNISSTKFAGSEMIMNNSIYKLDNKTFNIVETFNNKHNPYYF